MDIEAIREELRNRGAEMRALDPSKWRQTVPDKVGEECALLRCNNTNADIPNEYVLSDAAVNTAQAYLENHPVIHHCDFLESPHKVRYLSYFNDHVAKSPTDIAELLEKIAANL